MTHELLSNDVSFVRRAASFGKITMPQDAPHSLLTTVERDGVRYRLYSGEKTTAKAAYEAIERLYNGDKGEYNVKTR